MIKCLIVEDEQPAQEVLRRYIEDFPVLHEVGCVNNAMDAIGILKSIPVDLMFLDIHLPKISGLNFLRTLNNSPKVIITSAYPEYALEGYELDVLDYLLKPFSFERFVKAVNKFQSGDALGITVTEQKEKQDYLIIKNGKAFDKVLFKDIHYLMSDGDLVKFITSEKTHMEFQSLKHYEEILPKQFVRVHKSYVVNLDKLKSLDGNRIYIEDKEILVGRHFRTHLLQRLNIK